jgi:hypothetical protein
MSKLVGGFDAKCKIEPQISYDFKKRAMIFFRVMSCYVVIYH